MQYSIRNMMIFFALLAFLLAEWTSGLSIFSDSLWALAPAVLVTYLLRGRRPDRVAAAAALATYLALHFPRRGYSSSAWFSLPLVAVAWAVSRWMVNDQRSE